jgi:hypothetical protein
VRGFEEAVADLINGTTIGNDEVELAQLRELPPQRQLEVGIVLREAMQQRKISLEHRKERLMQVRTVEEALSYLNSSESDRR